MSATRDRPDGCGPVGADVVSRPVVESRTFGEWTLVSIDAPTVASVARPGQFVMLAVPGAVFALRRPLSIHRVRGDRIALLIERRGAGTRRLADMAAGAQVELSGPLGNGFDIGSSGSALLVAGGVGVAPLQFLADELRARRIPSWTFVGLRGETHLPLLAALDLPAQTVATEDGALGIHGTVVDALEASPASAAAVEKGAVVYGCGPLPMLFALRDWASVHGLTGYGSLEAHMACGTGACHGCVVATTRGYLRVCADGPVLPLEIIGEAIVTAGGAR
ncbi:MAG: dihydroorotate dehydrogenase electron transfer subunit [Actinobacteria bacterium]|nr:dihydroorotate dehydrogenase electron transfer subunit [Actinomycetota bacterium]